MIVDLRRSRATLGYRFKARLYHPPDLVFDRDGGRS